MQKNMGMVDRGARVGIALVALWLALFSDVAIMASPLATGVALLVAAIMAVTAVVGMCPLYRIVGLKTCSEC